MIKGLKYYTLKNEIDYPKGQRAFSTIKPKNLNQMINIVREEQKIPCLKRSDQLQLKILLIGDNVTM
jgi:hypothetical protein